MSYQDDTAEVLFDADLVSVEAIEDALDSIGYRPETSQTLDD